MNLRIILSGAGLVFGLLASGLTGEQLAPVSIDDLLTIRTVLSTRISPDGSEILFSRPEPQLAQNSIEYWLWKVSARGGEPVPFVKDGNNPRWSPDGEKIAFLRRENNADQIWLIDTNGHNPMKVTSTDGGVQDYYWSPDGKTIAFFGSAYDPKNPSNATTQIFLLEVQTGKTTQLTRESQTLIVHPWDPDANLSWSPDGKQIAFSVKPSYKFDDEYHSSIRAITIANGQLQTLVDRPGMNLRPLWSPDGKWIAFRSSFGKVDRFANHGMSIVSAHSGESPKDIGKSFEGGFLDGPYFYAWSGDGKKLYYSGPEGATIQLFSISMEDGRTERFSSGQGTHTCFSFSKDADKMAFLYSDPANPYDVFISPTNQYKPVRITESNPFLKHRRLGSIETIRWKSRDGMEIEGLLLKPIGYASGTTYPILTFIHGGPEGVCFSAFSPELPFPSEIPDLFPIQYFAGQGYAVFLPNFRGSGGYGETLRRAGNKNWSQGYFDDIQTGLDFLIEEGIADPKGLVLAASWRSGSVKVVGMLTQTDRFRAAVAMSPYPDFVASYESQQDFHLQLEGQMGGTLNDARENYVRNSPLTEAKKIKTPLLLVHNEFDWYIPRSQTLALHDILKENHVPGDLILMRSIRLKEMAGLIRIHKEWFDRWLNRSTF